MADRDDTNQPWYVDGLRFECQPDCGECCTTHGDFAYVYLDDAELRAMAKLLELDEATFREGYTELDESWTVLRMDRPACPFLDGTRCRVYDARPRQCRTFPFWGEHLTSHAAWSRLRTFCPGIDQGPKHDLLQIRATAAEADRE